MVSSLSNNGLSIDTLPDLIASLTTQLEGIYGPDINVASNTPDGQLINIFCQTVEDLLELLQGVYGSFGFMTAYGTTLDQRLALLGITRKAGTYTTTPVTVTVNRALTLYGLDQTAQPVFTLIDQTGNLWNLAVTHVFSGSGSAALTFQAAQLGPVGVSANTITQQSTTVLGVTSVNNPTVVGTVNGVAEENDTQFKIRAAQSFSLAATSPADSIEAALDNLPDVTDALVSENDTAVVDINGTPGHSVWCIVAGGTAPEIGQAIYAKKAPGCGMRGSQTSVITRPNGTTFTAFYDLGLSQNLYIKFGIIWRGATALDNATIIAALAAALTFKLDVPASVGDVVTAMATIAPTAIVDFTGNQGVSTDNVVFASIVSPTSPQYAFAVLAGNISIS